MYISSISFIFFFSFKPWIVTCYLYFEKEINRVENGHVHEAVMIVLLVLALKWWLHKVQFVFSSE